MMHSMDHLVSVLGGAEPLLSSTPCLLVQYGAVGAKVWFRGRKVDLERCNSLT